MIPTVSVVLRNSLYFFFLFDGSCFLPLLLLVLVFLLQEASTVHRVAPATDPYLSPGHTLRTIFFWWRQSQLGA